MNIREAAAGLQLMDDYLNEASAATVLWDVGVLLAENERLREALKFITTTRPDGTPAYSEAYMFDVATDALEAAITASALLGGGVYS